MMVKNKVADFDFWKKGFESHQSARLTAGLHDRLILRNVESPSDFYVLFEVSDPKHAMEFISSDSLSAFKKTLTVTAEPEYTFLSQSEIKHAKTVSIRDRIFSAFKAVDDMNPGLFAEHFAPTGRFQFPNQPTVVGPLGIQAYVQNFFGSIQSISHEIDQCIENGRSAAVRGKVAYGRPNGTRVEIPFSNFFELNEHGQFESWLIFIDLAPLHS